MVVSVIVLAAGACSDAGDVADAKGGAGAPANVAGRSGRSAGNDCDAGADRLAPRSASDSTCGLGAAPRWKLVVYEGSTPVTKPARSHSQGNDHFVIIELEGTVTGAGRGFPVELTPPPEHEVGLDSEIRYLRVQADARSFTLVTYGVADFDLTVAKGTAVQLSHHDVTRGHFYLPVGPIETSLRTAERMLLHYAEAAELTTAAEGFTAELGEDYCSDHDACHSWTGNTLKVADAQGKRVSLRPGESGALTDTTVYAGTTRSEKGGRGPLNACSNSTCAEISTLAYSQYLIVTKPPD